VFQLHTTSAVSCQLSNPAAKDVWAGTFAYTFPSWPEPLSFLPWRRTGSRTSARTRPCVNVLIWNKS